MQPSPRKSSSPAEVELDDQDCQTQETSQPDEPEGCPQEHVLLLDLDETLIRSSKQKPTISGYGDSRLVTFVENGEQTRVYVIDRPYLKDFITEVSKKYKIYIYTAGTQEYAEAVVKGTECSQMISGIYSRKDCKMTCENSYEKDIFSFGFDEKKLVFIDDWKSHTTHAPSNSINIKFFSGRQSDRELLKLKGFLLELVQEADVRCVADRFNEYRPKGLDLCAEEPDFTKLLRSKLLTV